MKRLMRQEFVLESYISEVYRPQPTPDALRKGYLMNPCSDLAR